jgi:hypothetical protein
MKGKLIPVGFNEMLGFVRRNYSALPEPSSLILSFNTTSAVGRFNVIEHQLSMTARGTHHSSNICIQ